jgi:hypothetical protein
MTDLHLEKVEEFGSNAGRGNLVGIQPYLVAGDYVSAKTFHGKIDGYLRVARQKGWLSERTIVILPEYIGTWLILAGEGNTAVRSKTLNTGMARLLLQHLPAVIREYIRAKVKDRLAAALFRCKKDKMAGLYTEIFSSLARQYGVTLVAGSIVLPEARVENGKVVPGSGALHNTCAVFGVDGKALSPLVLKAFPITMELPFTAPSAVELLPSFDTPAGKLGVLICADSWYPQAYARLAEQGIDWLVVPSQLTASGKDEDWDKPWRGYSGSSAPNDVDLNDIGRITEGQAWRKYAMAGRIAASDARCGMNVFVHGKLWDLGRLEGHTLLVDGSTINEVKTDGAALVNVWLPV